MSIRYFRVKVFTTEKFLSGNTAIVIPVETFPAVEKLQAIAEEFNAPATIFVCSENRQCFSVRWFSPSCEIKLCGHGAVAVAKVLWQVRQEEREVLTFTYAHGYIDVYKNDKSIGIKLPRINTLAGELDCAIVSSLGGSPLDISLTEDPEGYAIVRYNSEDDVEVLKPDFSELSRVTRRGIIVTARAERLDCDVVQRYFAPQYGFNEDSATGSAASSLAPYWHRVAGIDRYLVRQLSAYGACMEVRDTIDGVFVSGHAEIIGSGQLLHSP